MNATTHGAPSAPSSTLLWTTVALTAGSVLIIPVNFSVWAASSDRSGPPVLFYLLAAAQGLAGLGALVVGLVHVVRRGKTPGSAGGVAGAIVCAILGGLAAIGAPVGVVLAWIVPALGAGLAGGAWGRPLRVRGRVLHPELREGSDWTRGERPDATELDASTRAALEALWLHDAQKEHASVPAFARISWLLAAVGAPSELVEWSHRAALEEIDHTRRCFALAAGYGARSHGVEPMPDLLLGGLDLRGDPLVYLAVESLKDGCLLEDFNADVARACEAACEDPVARDVLGRIAREERSHADFSWALLVWLVARGGHKVRRALEDSAAELAQVARPTAVSAANAALVSRADATEMRAHGRIADTEWARLWDARLAATVCRARELLVDGATLAA